MPKKPTQPYGYINFAKDGKVSKHMFQLSGDKAILEMEVASAFAESLANSEGVATEVRPLPENDHDFLLIKNNEKIEVQLTEVALREYTTKVSQEQYDNGSVRGTLIAQADGGHLVIDDAKLALIFAAKIHAKKNKHYQKPANPLWLCIWSTAPLLMSFYYDAGKPTKSPGLMLAEAYCQSSGVGPFAKIWHFDISSRPYQIWPALPLPSRES